jgi:hypothetical protein
VKFSDLEPFKRATFLRFKNFAALTLPQEQGEIGVGIISLPISPSHL